METKAHRTLNVIIKGRSITLYYIQSDLGTFYDGDVMLGGWSMDMRTNNVHILGAYWGSWRGRGLRETLIQAVSALLELDKGQVPCQSKLPYS